MSNLKKLSDLFDFIFKEKRIIITVIE
jgi:hypothetical protein